ncbi:hypothetical protein Tco_0454599 [Tanacetum coccineum]
MKIEESLNMTFDETSSSPKASPLEDDDLIEEEAIEVNKTRPLGNDLEDKSLENNEIINIKESKSHPLENAIGNLNQRTLKSQAQDKSNFFCFLSTIEPKNINEALKDVEHERMILESVKHGPLIWPTIEENGVTRTKKYVELSDTEKIQADYDLKANNIILQGLPSDVYSLVNHHRVTKDLWERVQLLIQGTSLIKQERECIMYDAFDKFAHIKGESLHQYYLRFTQLINDMNIYKMKLEQFQVNTNFLNSLPLEWSKFVTDVKLVRYFHTTNFDQLNAYLEQHELYANEVRIMCERNQNPLALVVNHQMTPSHFNTYQSSYNNPQFQQQFSPSQSPQYGSIHPTQHYSITYPSTTIEITYPSAPYPNAYSSTVHQAGCPQPQSIPQIEYTVFIVNQQTHLAKFPQIDSGLAVPLFKQGDDPIDAINKMMSFLSTVFTSRFPSTNNQLRSSSNPRQQATIHDGRVTVQPV